MSLPPAQIEEIEKQLYNAETYATQYVDGTTSAHHEFTRANQSIQSLQSQGHEVPSKLTDRRDRVKQIVYNQKDLDRLLLYARDLKNGRSFEPWLDIEGLRSYAQEGQLELPETELEEIVQQALLNGIPLRLRYAQQFYKEGKNKDAKDQLETARDLKTKAEEYRIELPEDVGRKFQETEDMILSFVGKVKRYLRRH